MLALAAHGEDAGKHAKRGDEIDHHVDDHALGPLLASRGKPHEGKAHMADGGIGKQALDIVLADGRKGAQHHGSNGHEDEDLLPVLNHGGKGRNHDPDEQRHGGDLGGCRKEGRHGCRRAFIDIGRPHVERHGGNLEGKAGNDEHEAKDKAEA